jgi:hemoglobin-like flavoprotein
MFQEMIRALMDMRGNDLYGSNLLQVERVNHEQLGVSPEIYPAIFRILRDVIRAMLAGSWTSRMEEAWDALLSRIDGLLAPEAGSQAAAVSCS